MELNELRQQIDAIDRELVELFKARMQVSAKVAEYKKENGMAVLDPSRERALLSKVSELSGEEFEEYTRTLYSSILDLSRSYQHKQLGATSALYDEINEALTTKGDGFIRAMWCGDEACEDEVKAKTGAGSRCIPFTQKNLSDKCVCCGKPAKTMVLWGKAY